MPLLHCVVGFAFRRFQFLAPRMGAGFALFQIITTPKVRRGLKNNQPSKTMTETTEKPATEAVDLDRLVRLSGKINWDCLCDEMENSLPQLNSFLKTWGRHCGAPYTVFRGQLCKTILEIYKANAEASGRDVSHD